MTPAGNQDACGLVECPVEERPGQVSHPSWRYL